MLYDKPCMRQQEKVQILFSFSSDKDPDKGEFTIKKKFVQVNKCSRMIPLSVDLPPGWFFFFF